MWSHCNAIIILIGIAVLTAGFHVQAEKVSVVFSLKSCDDFGKK